jgi:antitoxin component of MazEF toxin-antitoxin module
MIAAVSASDIVRMKAGRNSPGLIAMTLPVKNNAPVIIPPAALRRAGFKDGQELEVRAAGGVITILPKLPDADDEYTADQRRVVDSRLAEARKGPWHGPFDTAEEAVSFIEAEVRKRRGARPGTTG